MDLIFLHGPPAVGKRTVAHALAQHLPARVLENHDSLDLALKIMEFGDPGFWDLVTDMRNRLMQAAARTDLEYLITTACYGHPEDLPYFKAWDTIITGEGGRIIPVHLTCRLDTMQTRVGAKDRAARGKITSQNALMAHLDRNDYRMVPHPGGISLSTDDLRPDRAAQKILAHVASLADPA